MNLKF